MARFRPVFAGLTRREIETIWYHLSLYRGLKPTACPFFKGEKFYDELESAGVYQAEVAASLLQFPNRRDLLRKVLGEKV